MNHTKSVHFLLRLSIASVFLYASVASTLQPFNWIGFIPQFFTAIVPGNILLGGFSLFQFILAVWLLSGWKSFFSALLSAITLLGIIGANIGDTDILFRDFAIFFAAVALAVGSYKK